MAFEYDYSGNIALLDRRKVAFFISCVVSSAVEEQVLCWANACCATYRVIISSFQSSLEKSVFELLLKVRHPGIWALGRKLYHRYPPEVMEALVGERILIFAVRNACRSGWQTAQTRNYLIASMCVYAMNIEDRSSSLDVLYDLETKIKAKTVFLFKTPRKTFE